MANAKNAVDFNDAAHAFLSPIALRAQKIFLERIKRVFTYLRGEMSMTEDFQYIRPGADSMTGSLFAIMKEHSTFAEWKSLIEQIPGRNNAAYKTHITGWGPA